MGRVYLEHFLLLLTAVALAVGIMVGLVYIAVRDIYKAAAIASVPVVFFLSFGHVISLIPDHNAPLTILFLHSNLMAIWLIAMALIIASIWLWMSSRVARQIAPVFNLVTVVISIFPGVVVGQDLIGRIIGPSQPRTVEPATEKILNDAAHPDVYYVIMDAYTSNRYLAQHWGYDNFGFTDALEERECVVALDSESNHSSTLASLASSLNMRYLQEGENPFLDPTGQMYARQLIADNEVARQLKMRGYTYLWVMSGYDIPSTISDQNIDFYVNGPQRFGSGELASDPHTGNVSFIPIFFNTTMLRGLPIVDAIAAAAEPPPTNPDNPRLSLFDNDRARLTWREAERIAEMPEATFTVIHLMLPHAPVRFDREGEDLFGDVFTPSISDPESAFFNQLEFVNNRTLEMVDTIQKKSSVPPIIIIQGDHGSNLGVPLYTDSLGNQYTPYFEIMNAYCFPNGGNSVIYPSISPVNSFRVMFNTYFDGDYKILDDSLQRWSLYANLFHFRPRSDLLVK